jgi:hypothetical protein
VHDLTAEAQCWFALQLAKGAIIQQQIFKVGVFFSSNYYYYYDDDDEVCGYGIEKIKIGTAKTQA